MTETSKKHEPMTKRAALFEHVFPGNKWKTLNSFDIRNVPFFVKELTPSPFSDDGALFGEAVKNKQGYADRLDLPYPDKTSLSWALLGAISTSEKTATMRGWVSDLLKKGERLGGACVKPISWLKDGGLPTVSTAIAKGGRGLYETGTAILVGVLDAEGKPMAVITFRKGKRPKKGIKEPLKRMSPNAIPIPIRSGI